MSKLSRSKVLNRMRRKRSRRRKQGRGNIPLSRLRVYDLHGYLWREDDYEWGQGLRDWEDIKRELQADWTDVYKS